MANSREERMQQRLRGAQRHRVEGISFGPIFPLEEEEEAPVLSPELGSSAKRRRLNKDRNDGPRSRPPVAGSSSQAAPGTASSKNLQGRIYEMPDNTEDEASGSLGTVRGPRGPVSSPTRLVIAGGYEEVTESPAEAPGSGQRRRVHIGPAASQSAALKRVLSSAGRSLGPSEHAVGSSSPLRRKSMEARRQSTNSTKATAASTSLSARRSARTSKPISPTAGDDDGVDELSSEVRPSLPQIPRSASAHDDDDDVDELSPTNSGVVCSVTESSPLAQVQRKARASRLAVMTNSQAQVQRKRTARRSSEGTEVEAEADAEVEVDELSPESSTHSIVSMRRSRSRNGTIDLGGATNGNMGVTEDQIGPGEVEPELEQSGQLGEPEEAEEIDDEEAARRLRRKQTRRSIRMVSPELGSRSAAAPEEHEPSPASSARKQPARQKAKQKAPLQKQRQQQQRQPKRTKKSEAHVDGQKAADGDADMTVPILVQRFTKPIRHGEDEPNADILNSSIPLANRSSVNSIDILSQVCDEVTQTSLRFLQAKADSTEDAATKRQFNTKIKAVNAFREELRSRFLEHTIALDSLRTLKKRVRAAQKEKLSLREEILRLRAEREQVALRMDALRIKHEEESKQVLRHIQISSAMHDIELAVDEGRAAPELTESEQKQAELANLELLISHVSDQVCADGHGAGILNQVKSFNAYLERAAAALQGR